MKKLLTLLTAITISQFVFASGKDGKTDPMFSGTVVDATSKKPVAEVVITATHTTSKVEHKITSDANGSFKIGELPVGNYKIKFEKDNYKSVEKTNVAVKAETPAKLHIEIINYKDQDVEDHKNLIQKFDF
jgi:Carboxypeptidase regulatory-like domain